VLDYFNHTVLDISCQVKSF